MEAFELAKLTDYSDNAVLDEVRRVAAVIAPARLTRERFDRVAKVHSTTLIKKFGSWWTALDLAGIPESQAPRPKVVSQSQLLEALRLHKEQFPDRPVTCDQIADQLGVHKSHISKMGWRRRLKEAGIGSAPAGRRYSDVECYENIVSLWTHYGRQPNFAELNRPPSTVGSKAYVGRWGGWRAALAAFIDYVNTEPVAEATPLGPEGLTDHGREVVSKPFSTSRSIPLSTRYNVLRRDGFRCVICGRSPANNIGIELHLDHVIPWSKGGESTEQNLRALCADCNLGKSAKIES